MSPLAIILSSTSSQHSVLDSALKRLTETSEYQQLLDQLRNNERLISISGMVAGAARALALAALQRETGKTFAIVTQSTRDLEPWEEDLRFWYCALAGKNKCDREVLVIPASESDPYAGVSPHEQEPRVVGEQLALARTGLAVGAVDPHVGHRERAGN